jgi:outer membrane lipoprotein SlyB
MKTVLIASTLALATLLQGCATRSYSNGVYTDADTQRAHSITPATVMAVRAVTIERATNGMGAAVGGNVGTALGGAASKSGNGQFFAAVLGGAAGSLLGQAVESKAALHPGLEISMRLDDGQLISVVQAADEPFKRGDRVRVLSAEGKSRVTR